MKLIGALLLLLLLFPVSPAYSYDHDDYCEEMCRTTRIGRGEFVFRCGSFGHYDVCVEEIEYYCKGFDDLGYAYSWIDTESFKCHALPPAVRLDCPKECKKRRTTLDPFSFPCWDIGWEVDCSKCTEECPTVGGKEEEGQYECPYELVPSYQWEIFIIKCPDLREKTEAPTTVTDAPTTPTVLPTTTTEVEVTTSTPTVLVIDEVPTTTPTLVVAEVTTTTSGEATTTSDKAAGMGGLLQKCDDDKDNTTTVYILVGVVVLLLLLIVGGSVAFFCYWRKMRRQVGAAAEAAAQPPSSYGAIEPSTVESVSSVSSYSSLQGPVEVIGKV